MTVIIIKNQNSSHTFKSDDIKWTYYGYSLAMAKKLFRQENNLVGKHIDFISI